MDARLTVAKREVAGLIDWLESGIPATESELAEYMHRLANYAKPEPQHWLPFTTDKDAANGL